MTLLELSASYRGSAELLRVRIAELKAQERALSDAEAVRALERRIDDLQPLLREMRELAILTARYYDRRYRRNEKYTL